MTPAEKYYAFLDFVSPMNLMLVAELDRCLPIDQVEATWTKFTALRSLTRIRVHADLTLADGGSAETDFDGKELPVDQWNAQLSHESLRPFGLDRPMRCRYVTSPDEGRARLVLIAHHSVVDGRVGIADLQNFIRALDGQDIPPQNSLSIAHPSPKSFPWQADRKELVSMLRGITARNDEAGPLEPTVWDHPDAPRRPRFFSLTLEGAEAAGLLAGAKANQARAYPAIAAGWLVTVAKRMCEGTTPTVQLATPVDLAVPSDDPDRATSPVVSVISTRHQVSPEAPWELARGVMTKVTAAMDRGEGELFFHLNRAKNIQDLDAGARLVSHALASAPPALSVTNLGIVDPGSDPEWLHSMCGYIPATPNQMVFVSGLGYRGRLVHSVSTDDSQVGPEAAGGMVTEYCDVVRGMGLN
jgi:hypothetical protein